MQCVDCHCLDSLLIPAIARLKELLRQKDACVSSSTSNTANEIPLICPYEASSPVDGNFKSLLNTWFNPGFTLIMVIILHIEHVAGDTATNKGLNMRNSRANMAPLFCLVTVSQEPLEFDVEHQAMVEITPTAEITGKLTAFPVICCACNTR